MSELDLHEIDYDAAYAGYLERFDQRFGDRPEGAFVKFGRHMVQKLGRADFPRRLDLYVQLHHAVKHMIDAGSTISDALVLDFVEASAWIGIEAPDMYAMFRGELGDPKLAAPDLGTTVERLDDDELRSTARALPSSREGSSPERDATEPDLRMSREPTGGGGPGTG